MTGQCRWLSGAVVVAGLMMGVACGQRDGTGAPANAPKPGGSAVAGGSVGLDSVIVQKEEGVLRLLNAEVKVPGSADVKHVDVSMKLGVDKDGKVVVESVETKSTTLVGVGALVAGVYAGDNKVAYELKGPAFDVDMRATWSIEGRNFNGTVVAGPVAGHPQVGGLKGAEGLPEAGLYGLMNHNQAFAGFQNSTKTLVNVRQVGDTLVITAYAVANGKYEQTGNVVLKRQ